MRVLVFTNMYPYAKAPFYGSFVADEAEALRKAGIDVDVYFVNGRRSKLEYAEMPFGFIGHMHARRYDVVHVHHSYCGAVATLQKSVPVVWTFHEGEILRDREMIRADRPSKRLAYSRRFKRWVAGRVDTLIVVADRMKEPLGRDDAITLPSGVDLETFRPIDTDTCLHELSLDPGRRYVLFPSTPARVEKRYALAREALELARSEHGLEGVSLLCLEDVPHSRVPLYMNASECLLMTSAFEASPVTIREALACDVPVISTDVGDAAEVLAGIAGCEIVEGDAPAIAAALARVLAGPRRVAGRDAMEKHSLGAVAGELVGIYEATVARRAG